MANMGNSIANRIRLCTHGEPCAHQATKIDATLKLWDLNLSRELCSGPRSIEGEDRRKLLHPYPEFWGHKDEITALSFDSEALVSGSRDKKILHWDLTTGKCIQQLDLIFTPTHSDIKMPARSLNNGACLLGTEAPMIGALQCYNSALATGTKDGIVRLWDLRVGKPVRLLEGQTDGITSLKF
nr:CFF_HP1_G0031190.mRNA.1.CDS.1 [Saccharomyces cerevisiae]